MRVHHFAAIDLGATSGRVIVAEIKNCKISFEEIHRFPDPIIQMQGHFYWDFPAIYKSVVDGLAKIAALGVNIESIGIDTWGVDFVCFGKDGSANPYARRQRNHCHHCST